MDAYWHGTQRGVHLQHADVFPAHAAPLDQPPYRRERHGHHVLVLVARRPLAHHQALGVLAGHVVRFLELRGVDSVARRVDLKGVDARAALGARIGHAWRANRLGLGGRLGWAAREPQPSRSGGSEQGGLLGVAWPCREPSKNGLMRVAQQPLQRCARSLRTRVALKQDGAQLPGVRPRRLGRNEVVVPSEGEPQHLPHANCGLQQQPVRELPRPLLRVLGHLGCQPQAHRLVRARAPHARERSGVFGEERGSRHACRRRAVCLCAAAQQRGARADDPVVRRQAHEQRGAAHGASQRAHHRDAALGECRHRRHQLRLLCGRHPVGVVAVATAVLLAAHAQ